MDSAQKEHLRQRIHEELDTCKTDISRLKDSTRPVAPDKALGRLTRMESLGDQGIGKAALNQQLERQYKLEKALEKIDQPGFGMCSSCRKPIPPERLVALPESTLCVACASRR